MKQYALFLMSLLAVLTIACAGSKLPRQAPLAVSPTSFGATEQRAVTNVFVMTDASGTMYMERNFPEAQSLSASFVKALPDTSARAQTRAYNVGSIGFGGDERVQSALAPFNRASVLQTVDSVDIMGSIDRRGGTTPIHAVIDEISGQLQGQSGQTAIVLFGDGEPDDAAEALASARSLIEGYRDPVCFHGVQVGDNPAGAAFLRELSSLTSCGSVRSSTSVASAGAFQNFAKSVVVGDAAAALPAVAAAPRSACAGTIRLRGIEFGFDRANIDSTGSAVLDVARETLSGCGELSIRIEGHTDSIGSESYNRQLSERRAGAVRNFLASGGIESGRLSSEGRGEANPIASNDTSDGRARNRRVELTPVQ